MLQVLVDGGSVDAAGLERARAHAQQKKIDLGGALLELGLVSEEQMASALAELYHLPYVQFEDVRVEPEALLKIPRDQIVKHGVFPVAFKGGVLTVVTWNPTALMQIEPLLAAHNLRTRTQVGTRATVTQLVEKHFKKAPHANVQEAMKSAFLSQFQPGGSAFAAGMTDEPTIISVVDQILTSGVKRGASDIHVSRGKKALRVRYRKDGALMAKDIQMNPENQEAIINRLKVLANADLLERRLPQDSSFTQAVGRGADEQQVTFRASFLPTEDGEKACLRIATGAGAARSLDELGLGEQNLTVLRRLLSYPSGLVLFTGPTGSGKSSTAYSCLSEVYRPDITVYTVEDPVEIVVPDYHQIRVNDRIGLTYATVLRSLLRQDPNVIFVAEMRDRETAGIATEAALTGHLILSTLHTNDACSTPARILELGVEPYVAATAVRGIVAQRMVRRLCGCKKPARALPPELEVLRQRHDLKGDSLFEPGGCNDCGQSGFKGRTIVAEVLALDEELADLVMNNRTATEVRSHARSHGFRPLALDAYEKALAGVTTLQEVQRVAGPLV